MGYRFFKACVAAIALIGAMALTTLPALAAPTNVKVSRVFQGPCAAPVCDSSQDPQLADNDLAKDTIQIQVTAASTAGLNYVRIQAHEGDGSWICIKNWATSAGSMSGEFNWNTTNWPGTSSTPPSGCPDSSVYGDITRNGSYELRVVANDALGTTISPVFNVRINNRPEVPQWSDEPAISGEDDREVEVELRWSANPEPDIIEYHFVRTDPNGTEREYAVSATKPGGQGCDRDGSGYICIDDDFPTDGFEGEYTYTLIAFRSSPSSATQCALTSGNCVRSSTSDGSSMSLNEPEDPTPEPTPTETIDYEGSGSKGGSSSSGGGSRPAGNTGRSGSGASYCDFFCGNYKKSLPYDSNQVLVPSTGGQRPVYAAGGGLGSGIEVSDVGGDRLLRSLAGGVLLMLAAAHMARVLRRMA